MINEFNQHVEIRLDYKSGEIGDRSLDAGDRVLDGAPRGDSIRRIRVYVHGKLVCKCDVPKGH